MTYQWLQQGMTSYKVHCTKSRLKLVPMSSGDDTVSRDMNTKTGALGPGPDFILAAAKVANVAYHRRLRILSQSFQSCILIRITRFSYSHRWCPGPPIVTMTLRFNQSSVGLASLAACAMLSLIITLAVRTACSSRRSQTA